MPAATVDRDDPAHAGQAVYSRRFLSVYDAFVPGPMSAKGVAFEHAHRALAPGGTLFGVTILGKDVEMNPPARAMIALSNARGILDNRADGPAELDAALAQVFPQREIRIRGLLALFTARRD